MARQRRPPLVRVLPESGITMVSRWVFNCFVIHDGGDGRPFVVDPGLPSLVPAVNQVVQDLGGDGLADLSAAIATHGHVDHMAGLPHLHRAGTTVHLPVGIDELRSGQAELRSPGPKEIAQILPVMATQPFEFAAVAELRGPSATIGRNATEVRLPFEPASWLADGDRLPMAENWEVIAAPGHVHEQICLFHAPSRTLLGGDAVLSVEGRAWFNPEYIDEARSATTGARLRDLDVEHVLPGHGLPVHGPRILADALGHDERPRDASKLTAVLRVLTNHAGRHVDR